MGCRGLGKIIDAENTRLSEFHNKTLAIDAPFWLQRYYYSQVVDDISTDIRTTKHGADISQLFALLISLPDFLRYNITPVFVFDPARRSRSSKAETTVPYLQHAPDTTEPEKHLPFLQRATELLLRALDIPYCEAPLYADADASKFVAEGRADAIISNDYDALLYGADTMLQKSFGDPWQEINLDHILASNSLSFRMFLDIAILTGTDEVGGPYYDQTEDAVTEIKDADDLGTLESHYNEYLRHSSLNLNATAPTFEELHEHYLNPPVTPCPTRPETSFPNPEFKIAGEHLQRLDIPIDCMVKFLDDIRETV